jgi:hypothetical protein
MPRWTIGSPRTLDLGDVAALKVRVISGSVAILATDDEPSLDVSSLAGQPLLVTHEAGILTITYEDLQWDGLLSWLRPHRHSADVTVTVPAGCPTQLGVVNASAIVSGISAKVSAKSVSGDITLDGVTGSVDAKTVSGDLEAHGLDGEIAFNSVHARARAPGRQNGERQGHSRHRPARWRRASRHHDLGRRGGPPSVPRERARGPPVDVRPGAQRLRTGEPYIGPGAKHSERDARVRLGEPQCDQHER